MSIHVGIFVQGLLILHFIYMYMYMDRYMQRYTYMFTCTHRCVYRIVHFLFLYMYIYIYMCQSVEMAKRAMGFAQGVAELRAAPST